MKKLFIIPLFLILLSCADDSSSSINNKNISTSDFTTPLVAENSLILGVNQVNYDKNKTFNTLIYQAQEPANSSYFIRNSYSISANMQQQETVTQNAVSPKKYTVEKGAKENLIDINKDIQQYALANNINPIDKNSSSLYRTIPQTVEVGTKWENVYLLDINSNQYSIINATCIAVSDHAYFFLQDNLDNLTDEQITAITTAFDKDYNIVHQYYGEETDTDGNGKVSFLIADFSQGLFGFFTSVDKYAPQDIPAMYKTNEADVLYINYNYFINGKWELYKTDVKATLIHEFQHMVLFDSRSRLGLNPDVNVWLNEGLSMLSEYYGGYAAPHYRYIDGYFAVNQGISLITDSSSQDYGLSYLFVRYLQIRFGDSFIKKIYTSQYTDIRAVEEAVNMDFNELFLDFTKMILLTGRNVTTDTRYNIEEFNYPEGSEGYNRNGFNLASVIDEVYSLYSRNNYFITSTGYNNKSLEMYGFTITKWSGNIDNITLSSSSKGIAGMYASW